MNFLMAYLNAAERIEDIVAGARDHDQRPDAQSQVHHKKPLVSKTKICWLLLVLTVAIPMAIFIGILEFFPSLMDISQDILNERKANKAANIEKVGTHPAWTYTGNVLPANPAYPLPPMYPPPPIARDEYHPKAAFERPVEGHRNLPTRPVVDDYSVRRAFENLNPERNPYDRYYQSPHLNPNYRIFQGLGHDTYGPLSAVAEESEEDAHRDHVRSSEKLAIDSPDTKILLEKIDRNWYAKLTALKKQLQQPAA